MPRITGTALRTRLGDLERTWAGLVLGAGPREPLPIDVIADVVALARQALHGRMASGVVLATTKADCPRWLDGVLAADATLPGSASACARQLGEALGAPAVAVASACASGTAALDVAARWLLRDHLDHVVVIGFDVPHAFVQAGFAALRALDPAGCRPFAADRAGLQLGEARAVVVLSRVGEGPSLLGWGATMDAVHLTAPDRSGSGLARACRVALTRAGIARPAAIIAHGTGTRFNDDAESCAYAQFAPGVPITASKGALGHSLGAAGLVDTVIAVAALQRGRLPGVAATTTAGCAAPVQLLPAGEHALPGPHILIANAGFGGLNAAVVVGPAAAMPASHASASAIAQQVSLDTDDQGQLGPLSARVVTGSIDASWGRMDLAARALVALVRRLGPLPAGCGLVLWSETGCAATDRLFERDRLAGRLDPQRFPYTLSTAPLGEASIRAQITGPGLTIAQVDADQARAIAADLLSDDVPAVILARVEADAPPHTAWAQLLTHA